MMNVALLAHLLDMGVGTPAPPVVESFVTYRVRVNTDITHRAVVENGSQQRVRVNTEAEHFVRVGNRT